MAMQVFSIKVGKNLKKFRKSMGFTQSQFAEFVGVNQSQYSKMEKGKQSVSCCIICMLEQRFGVNPGIFFIDQNETIEPTFLESYLHKNSSPKDA